MLPAPGVRCDPCTHPKSSFQADPTRNRQWAFTRRWGDGFGQSLHVTKVQLDGVTHVGKCQHYVP